MALMGAFANKAVVVAASSTQVAVDVINTHFVDVK